MCVFSQSKSREKAAHQWQKKQKKRSLNSVRVGLVINTGQVDSHDAHWAIQTDADTWFDPRLCVSLNVVQQTSE